ncbi:MAG TPA: protease pro-enzyme activation domain-containing protein [Verrucomicrobiae bacterium]|nr:protease pro-enzyme activation domain-containing protein [Verrucomicrobiae bacterium]
MATGAFAESLKTLPGHVPAIVGGMTAKATLPPGNRLNLAIGLPLRNPGALRDFLEQLYNPASPQYHHYLTPDEFTGKFGPTRADYDTVMAFARQNHLAITSTYANRLLLDVSGSVADINRAFHLTLRVYRHPTEERDFFAADVEPSVTNNLPIADIAGLDNYVLPRPMSLEPTLPDATPRSGSGPGATSTYMGNDFRAAYLPGTTLTGAGQSVGLLEFDGYFRGDISNYEAAAGLPSVPLQNVLIDGFNGVPTSTSANSGSTEVSLDIEMAVSMAPGLSQIVVFETIPGGFQNDLLEAMVLHNQISQFSCSWGWGGGPSSTTDALFQEMDAQGQSFFQASGDSDAFTPGMNSVNGVDSLNLANAPSSCPYITVVGGTTLSTTGAGGSWSSETVWNWGLVNGNYVGSSGGVSSYYGIPGWQTNVSMLSNGGSAVSRNTPDVAFTADNIFVNYGNGNSGSFGGTSCAAPLWAGLAALMNQQSLEGGRNPLGFINPALYSLAESTNYSADFHDITNGSNVSANSPAEYFATNGYDLCTGWGTPAGQSLINDLAGPPDTLGISPPLGFNVTELVSGPFIAASSGFQLTNSSGASLTWSLINTSAWLQATAAGGTLLPSASTALTVTLSATATNLPPGNYLADLLVSNNASHVVQRIPFTLGVTRSLVQNGGFETGDFSGWTFAGTPTLPAAIGVTYYNAVVYSGDYPRAVHSGNYGAFLGDTNVATISQTLATTSGRDYLVSFWLDNTVSGGGQIFEASWNGNNFYSVTNPPVFSWTNLQFLVAAAGNDTLEFGAANPPNYFGFDDVSVIPIASPALTSVIQKGGAFDMAWSTTPGLVYQVQYETNLLQPSWLNLTAPTTATNSMLSFTDSFTSPARFYRLMVAP